VSYQQEIVGVLFIGAPCRRTFSQKVRTQGLKKLLTDVLPYQIWSM